MAGMRGWRVMAGLFHAAMPALSAAPAVPILLAALAIPALFEGGMPAARAEPASKKAAEAASETPPRTAPAATSLVSADGRFLLVAQLEPPCLVVFQARSGVPLHTIAPAAHDGRIATRIAALRTAALRRSFIVAPADLPELWEISYDPKAEEIYDGLVHDYRFGEGVPRRGFLGLRRTTLTEPLADFVLDEVEAEAWGLAAAPPAGSGEGQVINLDVRRRVATLPATQMRAKMRARAEAQPEAPAPQTGTDLAQRRTASRPWPCVAPKVSGP